MKSQSQIGSWNQPVLKDLAVRHTTHCATSRSHDVVKV